MITPRPALRRHGIDRTVRALAALIGLGVCLVCAPVTAWATPAILYVDRNNANCSNAGSGSATQPFCTISKAASVVVAGQTVQVAAGSYAENVTPAHSGVSGSPIVFTVAPGAVVTVSGQTHGFTISSKSYVTIRGFRVTKTSDYGILVSNSSHVTIRSTTVSYAGQPISGATRYGIKLAGVTGSLVWGNRAHHNTDAGIFLDAACSGVQVSGNLTYANARQYTRAAPGIDVRGHGNTIDRNISHNNEDSGLQFYTGAHDNLVVDNVAYDNGDHGIDNLGATRQRIVSNSVYGSVTAGINVEGNSTGAMLANNISVDNGIGSPRTKGDIRVDASSIAGTTLDYDLVYISKASPLIVWAGTSYSTLAAFQQATGREPHGVQAEPKWSDPSGGDLHLTSGSPAIDAANSAASGETITDASRKSRRDDPGTPNTGAGPRTYDDRGAYEY
jgi:hypothetical protein